MEPFVQLVVQSAALGLLAYLIWWVTQTGAPQLFVCLMGIKEAMNGVHSRLEAVEESTERLESEVKELRREVEGRRST